MKQAIRLLAALCILFAAPALSHGMEKADKVLVIKSESKLYLKKNGRVIKAYDVAFGRNPEGHKLREGDERTPEGRYILDYKNPESDFYKSIHISYPNAADRARARRLGVNPGGAIMIHGQKKDPGRWAGVIQLFNWTDGCIAVTNPAMDEIWKAVEVGTPIDIKP